MVITPNLPEAALLTGREIASVEEMEQAARELHGLGPQLVVVKGGRRRDAEAVDVAFDGHSVSLLRAPWIDTPNVHGTGCTFSAAIAANLALGLEPLEAAFSAKRFVTRAIEGSATGTSGPGTGRSTRPEPDPATRRLRRLRRTSRSGERRSLALEALGGAVGPEHLGHLNVAVKVLVGFDEGDEKARRHGGAVQGVHETQRSVGVRKRTFKRRAW